MERGSKELRWGLWLCDPFVHELVLHACAQKSGFNSPAVSAALTFLILPWTPLTGAFYDREEVFSYTARKTRTSSEFLMAQPVSNIIILNFCLFFLKNVTSKNEKNICWYFPCLILP